MAGKRTDTRGRNTGEAVLEAAVDLMFQRGYYGTSLRDVAKVVGVQMSSLYHYYPSKQALLVAIMHATIADLAASITGAMEAAGTPRSKLIAGIRAHIMFHAERRKENFIADSELRSLEEDQLPAIIRMRDDYQALFREVLEAGIKEGEFQVLDVSVALSALFSMTNGVATWYRPEGRLNLEDVADQHCEIFLNGITAGRRGPVATG